MHCPHCGSEHKPNSPCNKSNEKTSTQKQNPNDKHPLVGLDNPFWKPEKPAAASL
jgi:hypothetical protein